ncbi:hypothetical protein BDR26DRAFT_869680 [Obelidium mucronatum]|nr:hypothetical protein BDR26DRAFT_869680 [Obelidium mucronatum]
MSPPKPFHFETPLPTTPSSTAIHQLSPTTLLTRTGKRKTKQPKELFQQTAQNRLHAEYQEKLREMERVLGQEVQRKRVKERKERLVKIHCPEMSVREEVCLGLSKREVASKSVREMMLEVAALKANSSVRGGGGCESIIVKSDGIASSLSGPDASVPPTASRLAGEQLSEILDTSGTSLDSSFASKKRDSISTGGAGLSPSTQLHDVFKKKRRSVIAKPIAEAEVPIQANNTHFYHQLNLQEVQQARDLIKVKREYNLPLIPIAKRYKDPRFRPKPEKETVLDIAPADSRPETSEETGADPDFALTHKLFPKSQSRTALTTPSKAVLNESSPALPRLSPAKSQLRLQPFLPGIAPKSPPEKEQLTRASILNAMKAESFNENSVFHSEPEFLQFKAKYQKPDTPPKHKEINLESVLQKATQRKNIFHSMYTDSKKNVERTIRFSQGYGLSGFGTIAGGMPKFKIPNLYGDASVPKELHSKFREDLITVESIKVQRQRRQSGSVLRNDRNDSLMEAGASQQPSLIAPGSRRESSIDGLFEFGGTTDVSELGSKAAKRMNLIREAFFPKRKSVTEQPVPSTPIAETLPEQALNGSPPSDLSPEQKTPPLDQNRRRSVSATHGLVGLKAVSAAVEFTRPLRLPSKVTPPKITAKRPPASENASMIGDSTGSLASGQITPPHLRLSKSPNAELSRGSTPNTIRPSSASRRPSANKSRRQSALPPLQQRSRSNSVNPSKLSNVSIIEVAPTVPSLSTFLNIGYQRHFLSPPATSLDILSVFTPIRGPSQIEGRGCNLPRDSTLLVSYRQKTTPPMQAVKWQPLSLTTSSERRRTIFPTSVRNPVAARNPNLGSRLWEGTFAKAVLEERKIQGGVGVESTESISCLKRRKKVVGGGDGGVGAVGAGGEEDSFIVPKYVRVWAGEKEYL